MSTESSGELVPKPAGMMSPRDLRVSDAEREHVIGILQKATGRGLIDLGEFDTRTSAVLRARTRAELNSVLVDLPGLVLHEPQATTPRDAIELRNNASSIRRSGSWTVPRTLVVRGAFGSTNLDFTSARLTSPTVTVELQLSMSSVSLMLPPGSSISTDELDLTMSNVNDRTKGKAQPGQPHFAIRGSLRASSVDIKYDKANKHR